jgi:hypothetical protein
MAQRESGLSRIGLIVDPLGSQATLTLVLLTPTGVGPHNFVWLNIVEFNARRNAGMM